MFVVKELEGAQYKVANDTLRAAFDRPYSDSGLIALPDSRQLYSLGKWPWFNKDIATLPTNDFRRVRQLATVGKPGFVLVEPAQGWEHVDEPVSGEPLPPTAADSVSPIALLAAAAGLGLVAWLLWLR